VRFVFGGRWFVLLLAAAVGCGGRDDLVGGDAAEGGVGPSVMVTVDATVAGEAGVEAVDAGTQQVGSSEAGDTAAWPDTANAGDGGIDWSSLDSDAARFVSDAGSCGTGIVTFRVYAPANDALTVSTSGDEEPNWLAITPRSGTQLELYPEEMTEDCESCFSGEGFAVPIGWYDSPLEDAGATRTWDGRYFGPGTCPPPVPTGRSSRCQTASCAAPGPYLATMCACAESPLNGSQGFPPYATSDCANPVCVDVPFEYPSATVVTGTLVAR